MMTHDEIAAKYGFKTRQVIHRLFKEYGIKSRNKSESSNLNYSKKVTIPTKEELSKMYETNSISTIAKNLGVSRGTVSKWMEDYEIENTYFKYKADKIQLTKDLNEIALKEIEIKYNFPITELKRRILNKIPLPEIIWSKDRIKQIVSLYDLNNPGFAQQILLDDKNVHNSIMIHTKNHFLESDKITERVYRILNDYEPDQVDRCTSTGEPLKFYTLCRGYGNSDLNLNRKGFNISYGFSKYSKISQEMFWDIYNQVPENMKSDIHFGELNSEKSIKIENNINTKLNKYVYSMDFCFKAKNIEFDGEYWHSVEGIKEKDSIRDEYIKNQGYEILRIDEMDYRKNKEMTLEKCIKFLTE